MWSIAKTPKDIFKIVKAHIFYLWIVCLGSDFIPLYNRCFFSFEVEEKEVTHVMKVSTIAGSTSGSSECNDENISRKAVTN